MQKVELLEPIFKQEKISKAALPVAYQSLLQAYDHVWKVTITPQKKQESRVCQVGVLAAQNFRTGSLQVENLGRIPKNPVPAIGQEDMRPAEFLVFGKGSQTFKVMVRDETKNFVEITKDFD